MLLTQGHQTQCGAQVRLLTENQESDKGLHSKQGGPGPLRPWEVIRERIVPLGQEVKDGSLEKPNSLREETSSY